MAELTVDSVCTKGPIYPMLIYFQNACPTEDFETNCVVLQDKDQNRTIAMEISELVYAGKEEKEDTEKTLILARDRKTGKVRLIEVGGADLKPLTKTDLDYLEQQQQARALSNLRLKKTNKPMAQNMVVQMERELAKTENIVTYNLDYPECSDSTDDSYIPPMDREITTEELVTFQQQQEISRLQFIELEKELEQQKKFRIYLETEMEKEAETVDQQVQDQPAFDKVVKPETAKINIDALYLPPIDRKATKVEDVYLIEKIFSEEEYEKIYQELEENNYAADLHPYIKFFMNGKNLSTQLAVLAACVSDLIKYLNAPYEQIRKSGFRICKNSKTLNNIQMKKFTDLVLHKHHYKVRAIRARSKAVQYKVICHIIVFMLLLNNFKFYLQPLYVAMNIPWKHCIKMVRLSGALLGKGEYGRKVMLKLPLVSNTRHIWVDKPSAYDDTDAFKKQCENKRVKLINQQLKSKIYEDNDRQAVTADDTANHLVLPGTDTSDMDNFYLPTINREAANIEDVYPVEKILSKDEYEQIYCELKVSNYMEDLHPYIQHFVEGKALPLQLTVLAVYASELIKLSVAPQKEIMKSDFKLCHHSKTLNDIIITGFTEMVYKYSIIRSRSRNMKDKSLCHVIVFTLIINNFRFKLQPFRDEVKILCDLVCMMKMIALIGASIVDEDGEVSVQLKIPLVSKPLTALRNSAALKSDAGLQQSGNALCKSEADPDDFYVPFINRDATKLEDVYLLEKIFSKDQYYDIYFEVVVREDYVKDLHPLIQSFMEGKTLSLELTVLAVYASELIKFLPARLTDIKKNDFKISHGSERLNGIITERFLSIYTFIDRERISVIKQKAVSHAIVCILILNDFKFELDPLLDALKKTCGQEKFYKIVRIVGASIVDGEDGRKVVLKLPLVPKTKPKTAKIDLDDFYLPTIDREATKVEDVYLVEKILSDDEYKKIHRELEENNYAAHLHPFIQSIIETRTLSLQLTVLAAYASELVKFVKNENLFRYKIRAHYYRICHHSETLNAILKKRLTDGNRIVKNKTQDMEDKIVCHVIICVLLLNDFQFELEPFCDAIKKTTTKYMQQIVSLVGASIVDGDEGPKVELKLPLASNALDDRRKSCGHINEKTPSSQNNKRFCAHINEKTPSSQNNKRCRVPRMTAGADVTVDQDNVSELCENIYDPDDLYLPPIDRKATNVQDVYPIEKFLSKDDFEKIYRELENSDYTEDLHPYILSLVETNNLSKEYRTVLAAYASDLIKFLHTNSHDIRRVNFRISQHSETLNDILMKGFTKYNKETIRIRSLEMKTKTGCHIVICILILNNFQFELDPFHNVIKEKKCGSKILKKWVSLVGASIVDGHNGATVELKLPLIPKIRDAINADGIIPKPRDNDIPSDQEDLSENNIDITDADDCHLPHIDREATDIENVYSVEKLLSKDDFEKIYHELEKSDHTEYLHPYIQSLMDMSNLPKKDKTVLALYASELIKFLQAVSNQVRNAKFRISHSSKTLNDILMKAFTKHVKRKTINSKIIISVKMKDKCLCHLIVCILILNNFQFKLRPFYTAIKKIYSLITLKKWISVVGASIEDCHEEPIVVLKLPLVPKTQVSRKTQATRKVNKKTKTQVTRKIQAVRKNNKKTPKICIRRGR